jgi:hypothetical protein
MVLQVKIIGVLLVILAIVHGIFPKYFNWKNELATLSLINKELMQVHTFFVALIIMMMGVLCMFYSVELCTTSFGKAISLGLGLFWSIRLFVQFFVYSASLWKGKRFETIVHIVFSALWLYLSIVFSLIYFT